MLFIFGKMQDPHFDKGKITFVHRYNTISHGNRTGVNAKNYRQVI